MVDTSHLVYHLSFFLPSKIRVKASKWNKHKILSQCDGIFSLQVTISAKSSQKRYT